MRCQRGIVRNNILCAKVRCCDSHTTRRELPAQFRADDFQSVVGCSVFGLVCVSVHCLLPFNFLLAWIKSLSAEARFKAHNGIVLERRTNSASGVSWLASIVRSRVMRVTPQILASLPFST